MKKVLVTGAGGFLGLHLLRALRDGREVVGADRTGEAREGCRWHQVAAEPAGLADAVDATGPDLVIDAAFVNRKDPAWSDDEYLHRMQAVHLRLFERCAERGVPLILISSSAVYGAGPDDGEGGDDRIDETAALRPVSVYGLAKTVQETLCRYVAQTRGLEMTIVRLFNLMGPGQGPGTVLADWVSQVAQIARGEAEPVLRVRNLATARDFVDVRDAARAVARVAAEPRGGDVLNVATGRSVGLRQLAAHLETLCPVPFDTVETHPRPATDDVRSQRGDAGRIRRLYGWRPTIGWRRSVEDLWLRHAPAAAKGA